MAIYNLFAGGKQLGGSCMGCNNNKVDDKELPLSLQPDLQTHGGYDFRYKVNWGNDLMTALLRDYGKHPEDLQVGDKLRIFVQPNHATLASLAVDFKKPSAGFEFKLQSVRDLDLTAKMYETTYDEATGNVKSESSNTTPPNTPFGASVAANTQYTFVFTEKPHTGKVDALELEITALPPNGLLPDMDIWFVRRFDIDGMSI